jgi:hypothetical protein
MLLMLAAPIVILGLVMTVPVAYRYLWPIKLERPRLFLVITLTTGLIVAGVATVWFFSAFAGVGMTGRVGADCSLERGVRVCIAQPPPGSSSVRGTR